MTETRQRLDESDWALREYHRAEQLYAEGRFTAATNRLDACLARVVADPRLLIARGHVHRQRGYRERDTLSWELAALDYERAFQLAESGLARACASECRLRLDQPVEAIEHGEAALRLGYESAEVHGNLAIAYAAVERRDPAEDALRASQRVKSSSSPGRWSVRAATSAIQPRRLSILTLPGEFPLVK
jgi:tetratricopeptide (TPR) repeat protein